MNNGYLSQPAIHKDDLYFVCDDDIWKSSLNGGAATRLTNHQGICTSPVLSPDGSLFVFTSNIKGQDDLYLMSTLGGEAKRLTFRGASKALCWVSNKKLIIASNQESCWRTAYGYELDIDSLDMVKLPFGVLTHLDYSKKGAVVIVRNGGDPARWKRYRGGTAGQIWTRANTQSPFNRILTDINSNLTDAFFVNERIYFLSDHENIGNVYSCKIDGSDIQSVTKNKEFYCRALSHYENKLVFQSGGELFLHDVKKSVTKKINIYVGSSFMQSAPSVKDATKQIDFASLSSDGNQLSIISRGHLFTANSFSGSGLHHSNSNEKRYHKSEFFENNQKIIAVQTHLFSDQVVVGDTQSVDVQVIEKNVKWGKIWGLRVSNDEKLAAITNQEGKLWVINLKTLKSKFAHKTALGRISDMAWSPCSRYMSFSASVNDRIDTLFLYDTKTNKTVQLLDPVLKDFAPTFDPTGQYLYFLSIREFHPAYSETHFNLSFPNAIGVYAICLNKYSKNPFENLIDTKNSSTNSKKKKQVVTNIDLKDIGNRVCKAPIELGGYWILEAVKNGFVFAQSRLKKHDPDQAINWNSVGDVSFFSLEDKKSTLLHKKVTSFIVSKNLEKLLVQSDEKLRIISSSLPTGEPKGIEHKDGWIDLSRFRYQVHPTQEWLQIYNEAWWLQKEHFWTQDMSKVDWNSVYKKYLNVLPKVKTRREFSDLLWEMQGELGTSHCYEFGGDYQRKVTPQLQGFLAADFSFDSKLKAMKVVKIYKGDSWIAPLRSPLLEPGVELNVGDLIFDIDGVGFQHSTTFYENLVHKNKTKCSLLILRKGTNKKQRVEIQTLNSEKPIIYRDWVENNRETVHRLTKGKVGYVHVPNMMVKGYAEFYRAYIKESIYDGLIIDVRYNGGGHVSQHLLTQLSQKITAFVKSRYSKDHTNPTYAMRGPIVCLTNEWAGSDGDIFSHNFKQLGIGPLVGVRTWGGVVGINGQYTLRDGTQTTQPEYSYYFQDVGFKVENYGTEPDIEVVATPESIAAGKDLQLERGIEEVLKLLKSKPAVTPSYENWPDLSVK